MTKGAMRHMAILFLMLHASVKQVPALWSQVA